MTVRQIEGELRTVVDVLRAAAAAVNGDGEAYVEPATEGTPRRSLTFGQWDRAADGVAGLFASHGVKRGSVLCLVLPSCFDYMVCYAAAARLGAITSGVNPRLGEREVGSILDRTLPVVTVIDDGADIPGGPTGRVLTRAEAVAAFDGPPPGRPPVLDPSDPVAVVWTSGTTGLPKGAVFDHRNLAAVSTGADILSQPGDRRLSPLPFAHVGSMTRLWDEIFRGVTTVITPTPWRAGDAIRVMEEERITVAQGVPTQWALMMAHPDLSAADLSTLRVAGTGASRMPAELVAEIRNRLGVPVVVRYSSTEASLGTGTVPGDPDDVVATSVGRPGPGVELETVDDEGKAVAAGQVGTVRIRSAAVMRGYWGGPPTGPGAAGVRFDAAATAKVLDPEGWVTTGDFGWLDEAGNLRLVGRANEMYIRGGYNVYPAEVEAAVSGHPWLTQVAVVGTPDPVLGEIGVAFAVLAPEAEGADRAALLETLRSQVAAALADYKRPDRLVVLDRLPLTAMMKVDKQALAALAADAAQLQQQQQQQQQQSQQPSQQQSQASHRSHPTTARAT